MENEVVGSEPVGLEPPVVVPPREMTVAELAAAILAERDINIVPVETPEWPSVNGQLYVRTMSGSDRERYIESIRKTEGAGRKATIKVLLAESGAKLAVRTLCNKDGKLLFANTPDVISALGEKSAMALQRVIDKAADINGLGDEDKEKNESAATNT
jgi:hypothetical protein